VATRLALHRLAEQVISPARERANGKIGLRFTRGGFGTPFFGEDVQLRVEAKNLVVQSRDGERAAQITTLTDMATHVGPELLEHAPVDDEPLDVDGHAARFIGDWFGFGAWVLEELRARVGDDVDPSRVQIWPEHFDIAVEIGVESAGPRATYGASPGDEEHPEPYLYVAPWGEIPDGELFGATAFKGAELPCRDLLAAGDFAAQSDLARRFFEERMAALAGAR
jgi:hypothetical protein